MIHDEILQGLSGLGVDVEFLEYSGTAETYITFLQIDDRPTVHADDTEVFSTYYYQFNLYSKTDYKELLSQLKEALFLLGGTRLGGELDSKTEDGYYRRTVRYQFLRKTGETE